jgi:hypothetical protein
MSRVFLKLKKLIDIEYVNEVSDFNNSLLSSNVSINSLNNLEDYYSII